MVFDGELELLLIISTSIGYIMAVIGAIKSITSLMSDTSNAARIMPKIYLYILSNRSSTEVSN